MLIVKNNIDKGGGWLKNKRTLSFSLCIQIILKWCIH